MTLQMRTPGDLKETWREWLANENWVEDWYAEDYRSGGTGTAATVFLPFAALTRVVARVSIGIRDWAAGNPDADPQDRHEAEQVLAVLEELQADVDAAEAEWDLQAAVAQDLSDQIDQRVQAMQLILRQYGQQHAARTANTIGREISDLIDQWSEANAEAERLKQEYGAIRARFESIAQRLQKSAAFARDTDMQLVLETASAELADLDTAVLEIEQAKIFGLVPGDGESEASALAHIEALDQEVTDAIIKRANEVYSRAEQAIVDLEARARSQE
jgi:gas vesicle protein